MAKNQRVRQVMTKYGVTQTELAKMLYVDNAEISHIMKYELSRHEQDEIIRKMRDYLDNEETA